MEKQSYAVLTGDIVASRKLLPERSKALQQRLKTVTSDFNSTFPGSIVGTLGITQGDGWQVALKKPVKALRLALFLRAVVKADFETDTRVSIGIGTVERLETGNIIESTGLAFERSGHGLELLKNRKSRMSYRTSVTSGRLVSAELLLVAWLDSLATLATAKQASLLREVLLNLKQEKVAEKRGLAQSTVSEGLTAVGWNEIRGIVNHFENIDHITDKEGISVD
jgi:hypothetical protein